MLTAYLDESGHESKAHVVVAGFFGDDKQWKEFGQEWRKGLGKRKRLHMRTLRWSDQGTKKLLAELGPIPDRSGLTPIFGAVRVSDYADLVPGGEVQKMLRGYYVALLPVIDSTIRHTPPEETLKIDSPYP